MTTDDFLALVEQTSPGLLAKVDATAWVDAPGLPASYREPTSARLSAVLEVAGRVPTAGEAKAWSVTEWQLYLEAMPRPSPLAICEQLDATYALTRSKNAEVLVSWLVLACESGYDAVLPRIEALLGEIGRMKYLKPLYKALAGRPATRALASDLFARLGGGYHPIAQQMVRRLLATG